MGSDGGRPQSAAAMRQTQLAKMREQEQRKRTERIAGTGMAVAREEELPPNHQGLNATAAVSRNQGPLSETEKRMAQQGLETVFDPTGGQLAPNVTQSATISVAQQDLSDMRSFVMRPCARGPSGGQVMQCQIFRQKSSILNLYPEYRLHLKDGNQFLLSARKRKKSKTANYVISLESDNMSRHSTTYMGKVRSNFIGTEFTIFDKGMSQEEAKKSKQDLGLHGLRQEMGFCTYESNILGAKGPRKMHVIVPTVYENGQREECRPVGEEDALRALHEDPATRHKVTLLHNKAPKWNEKVAAFVLNFNGRVTMASVKNFQLVAEDQEDTVLLQFGKVGKDEFTMDLRWPFSPLQAFAICLGSLDNKLACE